MSAIAAKRLLVLTSHTSIDVGHQRQTTNILYYHPLQSQRMTVFAVALGAGD